MKNSAFMKQTLNYLRNQIVSLINGDSFTFFLFLSLPCCYQCRFKIYIGQQTITKTEETVPL